MTKLNCFRGRIQVSLIVMALVLGAAAEPQMLRGQLPGQLVPDVTFVPPDAFAAVVGQVSYVLKHPKGELLPIEVFSAWGKRDLGLDPIDVDQVLVVAALSDEGMPVTGVVIRLSKAYPFEQLLPQLAKRTTPAELDGKTYRRAELPEMSIYPLDDKTIIVAHEPMLRKMLENHRQPQPGPLSNLMRSTKWRTELTAIVAVEPVRPMLQAALRNQLPPPPFAEVVELPDLIDAMKFEYGTMDDYVVALTIVAPDAERAEKLEGLLNRWLDMGSQLVTSQIQQEMVGEGEADEIEQAMQQYLRRVIRYGVDLLRPQRTGRLVVVDPVKTKGPQAFGVANTGILVALLLPAVQAAREAARRAECANNLRRIGLAMHNYHDTHRRFPARASFDENGKPLLSWRVHLLPFLEQQQLYEQFHLDEPWDSEHNKQLIPQMPDVYRCPSAPTPPNTTVYQVPVGKGTLFEGTEGKTIAEVRDGTSNTIMVVETSADKAVIWTKPDDWEVNMDHPMAGLQDPHHRGGFNALFADAAVRFITEAIDPDVWRATLTIAGGETVRLP